MTKSGILSSAAIAGLVGAMAFAPVVSRASTPSSPAERAATAELNRNIMGANATADDRAKMLAAQYEEQKRQYEEQRRQYQAQLQSNRASENR